MTEKQILTIAKKIIKKRIKRFFTQIFYEVLRAFFTFIVGLLIVTIGIGMVLLCEENGVYDIGILFILIPLSAIITYSQFEKYYGKEDRL